MKVRRNVQVVVLLANFQHSSSLDSVRLRPPRQTRTQNTVQKSIAQSAANLSQISTDWVLQYLDSIRPRLHETLQSFASDELLHMFEWEIQHLPIFHNAPLFDGEFYVFSDDGTAIDAMSSGFIENPCQLYVRGGLTSNREKFFTDFYNGRILPPGAIPDQLQKTTMRTANECLLFSGVNMQKSSLGDALEYGGMTYMLNPATMEDRIFLEAWDSGWLEMYWEKGLGEKMEYPPFGTRKDFLHLVRPHVELVNLPVPPQWPVTESEKGNYSLADVMNRWWAPDTPRINYNNAYFEVMATGNVWLPEDVLYVILKFSEHILDPLPSGIGREHRAKSIGMWGKLLGSQIRDFLKKSSRPLLWAEGEETELLLDPYVGSIEGGRITRADVELFEDFWHGRPWVATRSKWSVLVGFASAHLHFHFLSWWTRQSCSDLENDVRNMVMGTDGHGVCVYWKLNPTTSNWECLNDGSCEQSGQGPYASEGECQAACGQGRWACHRQPGSWWKRKSASHFCYPNPTGNCNDVQSCEQVCGKHTSDMLV